MSKEHTDKESNLRMELIRLKVDARSLSLHEWLERAQSLIEKVEQEAITRDRLTRIVGPGKVVEIRAGK